MASIFQDSVAQALADQSWWQRRKNSLTDVGGTVLQLANLALAFTADAPLWVNVLIGALIGVAQIIIQAGTLGPITPSMATRLERAGEVAHLDRVSASGIVAAPVEPPVVGLPVYGGVSTAVSTPAPYVGEHRLGD